MEHAEPYVQRLADVQELEEIRLGGNTIGIAAAADLGRVLATKSQLRVRTSTAARCDIKLMGERLGTVGRLFRHFHWSTH